MAERTETGGESDRNSASPLALAGPERVRLRAVAPGGPLADRWRAGARFRQVRVALTNVGPGPVPVADVDGGPLRHAEDGTATSARLRADLRQRGPARPLAAGEPGDLCLTVDGRLPPGRYEAEITLRDAEGRRLYRLPVSLAVRAHWGWALACLLAGLLTVGVVALLAGEAEVRDELARVLEVRRSFYELTDRYPGEQLAPPLIHRIEDALNRAVEVLGRRRAASLRDDRLRRAAALRAEAEAGLRELTSRIEGRSPGAVSRALVETVWKELGERCKAARELRPPPPEAAGFARSLERFLAGRWPGDVGVAVEAIEAGLGPRVEAVALAASAGEDERARRLGEATRRHLLRGAHRLDRAVGDYLVWRSFAGEMSLLHDRLSRRLRDPGLAPAARSEIDAQLEAGRRALSGEATLDDFRRAHAHLQQAWVCAVKAGEQRMLGRLQAAFDEVSERTSLAEIEAAVSRPPAGDAPGEKRRRVLAVLALWKERIATVESADRRQSMERLLAELEGQVDRDDWQGAGDGMGELLAGWLDYQRQEDTRAQESVLVPHCRAQAALQLEQLAVVREHASHFDDDPEIAAADRDLARWNRDLASIPLDVTCYDTLVEVAGGLVELEDRLLAAHIRSTAAPGQELLAIAEDAGATAAAATARRLLRRVRPLEVMLRTPAGQRTQERAVHFEIGGLDPVWGAGTAVAVDFGDGSPTWTGDAETVRRQPLFAHRYSDPGRHRITVTATSDLSESSNEPGGELLGKGTVAVDVASDPVSAARQLAGMLLNLRFALALVVGLMIQGWRVYSDQPFGARRRDYLEAFAVGFGAHVGIDGLTALLPGLIG